MWLWTLNIYFTPLPTEPTHATFNHIPKLQNIPTLDVRAGSACTGSQTRARWAFLTCSRLAPYLPEWRQLHLSPSHSDSSDTTLRIPPELSCSACRALRCRGCGEARHREANHSQPGLGNQSAREGDSPQPNGAEGCIGDREKCTLPQKKKFYGGNKHRKRRFYGGLKVLFLWTSSLGLVVNFSKDNPTPGRVSKPTNKTLRPCVSPVQKLTTRLRP